MGAREGMRSVVVVEGDEQISCKNQEPSHEKSKLAEPWVGRGALADGKRCSQRILRSWIFSFLLGN